MAAPKSTEENRVERRLTMVDLRTKGWNYSKIARKFGVAPNTVRVIVLKVKNNEDPKYDKANPSPYQRSRNRKC